MSRRDEIREYENDVFYDVWRSGGDPDRIDYERVDDSYWEGRGYQAAAQRELHEQRKRQTPEEQIMPQPYMEVKPPKRRQAINRKRRIQ